jgi:hypothetical protein
MGNLHAFLVIYFLRLQNYVVSVSWRSQYTDAVAIIEVDHSKELDSLLVRVVVDWETDFSDESTHLVTEWT